MLEALIVAACPRVSSSCVSCQCQLWCSVSEAFMNGTQTFVIAKTFPLQEAEERKLQPERLTPENGFLWI